MLGAFLLPNNPFTAPSETIPWLGPLKLVDGLWQLEQDCPIGLDKFLSLNINLPNLILSIYSTVTISFSLLQDDKMIAELITAVIKQVMVGITMHFLMVI